MSILKPFRHALLACVALLAVSSIAKATTFNAFGTVAGTVVSYTGGERDTWSVDPVAPPNWLFGNPVITGGNNLSFTPDPMKTPKPLNFSVSSSTVQHFEDGTLSVDINANSPAGSITLMSIAESGSYMLQNATAASTAAAVLNIAGLSITSIDGGPALVNPIAVNFTESFTRVSGNGPFVAAPNSIVFSGSGPIATGVWSGSATFDIAGALAANGLTGHRVTGMSLLLDNILSETSEPNSVVSIDKKSFIITTGGLVPEPSSIILGVLGGLSLGVVGYRKKVAKKA